MTSKARPINYDKWAHIEISDDEDDTHPNVDTPSLFKWRHEARLAREEEQRKEKAARAAQIKLLEEQKQQRKQQLEKLVSEAPDDGAKAQVMGISQELTELEKQQQEFLVKEAEIERLEREHPTWNVDNISKEKKNRTLINKDAVEKKEEEIDMVTFFEKYKAELRQFGMLSKAEESHKYLKEHPHLVCEHLGSYLIVWCVDLEVEGKRDLMERVAHQTIIAQFIMELAKSVKRDPRQCVDGFFARMKTAEKQYMEAFNDELNALKARVKQRAIDRQKEAEERARLEAEEERKSRLGPGGLDPIEVLESLPKDIREAFEVQDTPKLRAAFAALSPEDAQYHFKRVVDSGLWVPAKSSEEPVEEPVEEEEETHERIDEV